MEPLTAVMETLTAVKEHLTVVMNPLTGGIKPLTVVMEPLTAVMEPLTVVMKFSNCDRKSNYWNGIINNHKFIMDLRKKNIENIPVLDFYHFFLRILVLIN